MATKEYSIYNKTREGAVGDGVTVINSAMEPLTALRVMIEGLGSDNEAGLWLTHITSFPMVPRLSPFDLIYLDKNFCVVDRFELLPAAEMPRFKNPAASALILPFQTISSLRIGAGDEFVIRELIEADSDTEEAEATAEASGAIEETAEPLAAVEKIFQPTVEIENAAEPVAIVGKTLEAPTQVTLTISEVLEPLPEARPAQEVATTPVTIYAEPAKQALAKSEGPVFARRGKRKRRGKRQTFQPLGTVARPERAPHDLVETENGAAILGQAAAPEVPVVPDLAESTPHTSFDSPFLPATFAAVAAVPAEPAVPGARGLNASSPTRELHEALALSAAPEEYASPEVREESIACEDSIATL